MNTEIAPKFSLALSFAFGCGMLDAQNIRKSLTKDNAPNFLTVPEHVPAPEAVGNAMDAYRLGYWSECKRIAEEVVRTNA